MCLLKKMKAFATKNAKYWRYGMKIREFYIKKEWYIFLVSKSLQGSIL
jgi:hypothetical protein